MLTSNRLNRLLARWPKRPWIIAHRGASGLAPENTLTAFILAAEQGADWIELDLRLTKDGHVVVCHDATVNRTTNGKGPIDQYSLAELQALDAGYSFSSDGGKTFPFRGLGLRIPTLEEVIAVLPERVGLNVEIKSAPWDPAKQQRGQAIAQRLAELVRQRPELQERLLASSFDARVLTTLRQLAPDLPLGLCTIPLTPLPQQLQATLAGGFDAFHPMDIGFDEHGAAVLATAHLSGLLVNVWTVDTESRARELALLGVDGIITDFPELARRACEQLLPQREHLRAR